MTLFVGLISGTSVDAIDTVLVEMNPSPKLLGARHHPIPSNIRTALLEADNNNDLHATLRLDVQVGQLFAEAVTELLDGQGIEHTRVTAIGSHGQTVSHYPHDEPPFTCQIGDPNVIAELTGITTVADFRRRDVAAGGEGAPLAPLFHQRMFETEGRHTAVLNVGGISNLTVLYGTPRRPPLGFDTGPGNGLLDAWADRHLGQPMDIDAGWASTGQVDAHLLEQLMADPYFKEPSPKSTGKEAFNVRWLDARLDGFAHDCDPVDVQRTLVELTVQTIVDALVGIAPECAELLVCGGGEKNPMIMHRLRECLPSAVVRSTATAGVDPDYLEAIAFAWLASRTLNGETGNLPSVTGAGKHVVLGAIYAGAGFSGLPSDGE